MASPGFFVAASARKVCGADHDALPLHIPDRERKKYPTALREWNSRLLVSPSEERALTLQLVNRDGTFSSSREASNNVSPERRFIWPRPRPTMLPLSSYGRSKKSMLFVTRMFVNTP